MQFKNALVIAGLIGAVSAAQQASAAGFYIQEQSVKGQGTAFAGAAANPEDASVIFNNPAAMTDLSGRQGAAGVALIIPSSKFTDQGSNVGGGPPTGGNDGGDPFSPIPVPSLYAATPLDGGKVWLGLAITAPFGLSNEYNSGWVGRYDSTKSVLRTTDIDPAVAVKVTDNVSLGAGIDFQHAYADLQQNIFTGGPDLLARVQGDSWKVGYNVGVLWDLDQSTKLGLHYRSAITQNLSGTLVVAPAVPTTAASADLKLPDILEFGATHQFSQKLKVLGSVNWFGWNNFNEIRVRDALTPNIVATEDYRNTFSAALGAEWQQDDKWTYRGGVQFDETPTTSHRDTRVPDSNRFWLSAGASYNVTPAFTIDGALSHLFMPDASIKTTDTFGGGPTINTIGSSSNQVTIVSLGGSLKF